AHVKTAPLRQELLEISDFLDQRMAERVGDFRIDPPWLQKALLRQVVEIGRQCWAGIDALQHAVPEGAADHGGGSNDVAWSGRKAVDARPQHLVDAVGNNQR